MATVRTAAFVGREREMDVVTAALVRARLGGGRLIAITGEAGVGKTRLAEELTSRAGDEGFATSWGTSWTGGGAPPLWPWHDVLAQLGIADADALLELRRPGDAERFLRFRAVTAELARAADAGPLLIVLDDLHAADPAAALLARFAARSLRRCPLLLVVTARTVDPDAPGGDALAAALAEGTTIALRGLDEQAVAELVAAEGRDRDATVLAGLTGGNPLLLREALDSDADENQGELSGWVRRVLLHRLATIRAEGRAVLVAAAVLGSGADDDAVAALSGAAPDTVAGTRELARSAGFLRREAAHRFAFAHALLGEALLDSCRAAEVAELHARAAELLAAGGRGTASRRARHLLAAARSGAVDVATAMRAAREAAQEERGRGAHERASRLLRAALDLAGADAGAEPWLELAQAELAGGRLSASRPAFLAALERDDADPVTRAEAAIGLGGIWVFEHRDVAARDRFQAAVAGALAALGPRRPDLAARLRARLAAERIYVNEGTVDDVRSEVNRLRGLGDPGGLAEALSLLHHVILGPQDARERATVADELVATAASTGDTVLVLMGALWQTVDLFLAGSPGAERSLHELRQRADALRVDAVLYIVELIDGMLLGRSGRVDEAEAAVHRCLERGLAIGDADALGYFGAQLLYLRWLQGRSAEMLPLAGEIAGSPTVVAAAAHRVYPAALAALTAHAGPSFAEQAHRQLDALVAEGLDIVPPSSNWLLTLFCVVEAADRLGEPGAAEIAYPLLLPYAGLPVMGSLAVACFGPVDRVLGLAARTTRHLDDAVAHLEAAVEAGRRLGNRPMLALTRGDLGVTLLRRGRAGDAGRAAALLGVAAAALDDMGLPARAAEYRAAAPSAERRPAALRCAGASWEVVAGLERAVVPDGVGMHYLARLLAAPRTDLPADELAATGVAPLRSRQEVLDPAARAAYRRRVDELQADLDAADAAGDPERARRAQAELDAILTELGVATGLGGRARTFADGRERARTAVQKALRRAIARIAETAPELGAALTASVQTGLVCRYEPVDGAPEAWTVDA